MRTPHNRGLGMSFRQVAIESVDRLVSNMNQRLEAEGYEERIPPCFRNPLEGLAGGPAGN